jgi:HEAT repeat protein
VADPSLLVQQQVASALRVYSPASIPGLIDLVLADASEIVAEKAASILAGMGKEVVVPISQVLSPIVPGRTRLLVQVLDQVHDARAIPAFITLLKAAPDEHRDPLLTISVIRALSRFSHVGAPLATALVAAIRDVLSNPQPQIYEEAIDALNSLGTVALDALIAALDIPRETVTTPRVRRAILGMVPFPGELLLNAVARASDAQAQQIMIVFRMQGAEAAHVLVQHFFERDERVRGYVRRTLSEMQGAVVVPALLEVLNRPAWRDDVTKSLLTYSEAIPPLVNLLGDSERADAAASILPRFGPAVLPSLVSALDDPEMNVEEYAQNIIVTLVRHNPATLSDVVHLFTLSLPLRAHEALLEVLTNDLVDISVPALLDGLEDAHLIDDVSEALVRLARRRDWQSAVLGGLLESLRNKKRRRGAETALIRAGALAVWSVGELITDQDQVVAQSAQHILREIGAPALPFIWAAHGDTANRARREAAMATFYSMPTEAIKDALVELLRSDQPEDIAMAQALLLERIHDEATLPQANQEMIPALLEYVQIHDREIASLRVLALLFLLGGDAVVSNLVQVLYDNPDHHEQLVHAFLFLGEEARNALAHILNDPDAPARLRAEAVSMLGLLGPERNVYEYAQSLSSYGLTTSRVSVLHPDKLTIALRALGSLLASGDWDVPTLQHMRGISQEGSAQSELYNVLLGWRYQPEIARLEHELQNERDARKSEIMSLTARIVHDQTHINEQTRSPRNGKQCAGL